MTTRALLQGGLLTALLVASGCANERTHVDQPSQRIQAQGFVSPDQARDLTVRYRRQAAELSDLAQRAEWEARWYVGQFGEGEPEAVRRQAQARQLWAAVEEADQLARDYGRQIPHGQVN